MWLVLLLLTLLICALFLTLSDDNNNLRFARVIYIALFIAFSLRGKLGTDWKEYKYYFKNAKYKDVVDKYAFEVGYRALNNLFSSLGLSYWVMVFIITVVISILVFVSARKLTTSEGIFLALTLFYFFYPCIEALRQMIVVALFYYSMQYIGTDSKKYFLINLIGILFHRTGIITLLFYFFYKKKVVKYAIIIGSLVFSVIQPFVEKIIYLIPGLAQKYSWYISFVGGANLTDLLSVKLIEYVFVFILLLIVKNNSNADKVAIDLLELGLVILIPISLFMDSSYRLTYYTDLGLILAYCSFYEKLSNRKAKIAYSITISTYVVLRLARMLLLVYDVTL